MGLHGLLEGLLKICLPLTLIREQQQKKREADLNTPYGHGYKGINVRR
jgi:hypothetical protein